MSLLDEMNQKATAMGIPLSAHFDITWRCNERCVHCYLDHDIKGEMSTEEIKRVLDQLAATGTFFLAISGGEPFLRRDCFEILEYARALRFNVKLKTNAVMIGVKEAARLKQLGIEQIQISVYSHRPEVHDAITKLPGSLKRTIAAIQRLKAAGLKVSITNVLMKQNLGDGKGVQQLAKQLGADYVIDPTITPKLDGDRSIMNLGLSGDQLKEVFRTEEFVGNIDEYCATIPVDSDVLDGNSCSAGHTLAYISPFGDVYPCVQFPMACGNLREQSFGDIWHKSTEFTELREVRIRDLPTCSGCGHAGSCTRCPGLAYMEGNYRGPSTADCEKSYARTGIPSANMLLKAEAAKAGNTAWQQNPVHLVQITC
jgi:AdoMet-dependent heme synthase